MNLSPDMLPWIALAALLTGGLSAALYARKRQWLNAMLALIAALALGALLAELRLPLATTDSLQLATDNNDVVSDAALLAVPQARSIALSGDGLREAQWRDLPARPLQWKPAAAELLWLDFPRSMSLGRRFTLSVRRAQPQAGWRLQLLAENQQVLAEASALGPVSELSVQWLPPVAEAMVLQARLLDAAGKTIAQGPVPVQVKDALPLQIQGRFDAPSFDAAALNRLLAESGANVDWQVTLGKAVARSETARQPLVAAQAMFVDAAYLEHLSPQARSVLLAQTARGLPLVIMGSNAANAALWQQLFGLTLHEQSKTTEKEDMRQFGSGASALAMPPAGLNPDDKSRAPWSVLARDSKQQPWLWQRSWQQGRIVWIGVADWHRYAISAPQALGLWWQEAMDRLALAGMSKSSWLLEEPMPLPQWRSEICAQGLKRGTALRLAGQAPLLLQARADHADAVCAAFWPQQAGWLRFTADGIGAGMTYVYAATDWPAWQRALRRDATAAYAARLDALAAPAIGVATATSATPAALAKAAASAAASGGQKLPATPFALLFGAAMLALWWREQRN